MVLATRLESFQVQVFLVCDEVVPRRSRAGLKPCLVHSRIQNVHQTNARVRKCTCERKGSKRWLSSKFALFSPFVNIWNVAKGYAIGQAPGERIVVVKWRAIQYAIGRVPGEVQ